MTYFESACTTTINARWHASQASLLVVQIRFACQMCHSLLLWRVYCVISCLAVSATLTGFVNGHHWCFSIEQLSLCICINLCESGLRCWSRWTDKLMRWNCKIGGCDKIANINTMFITQFKWKWRKNDMRLMPRWCILRMSFGIGDDEVDSPVFFSLGLWIINTNKMLSSSTRSRTRICATQCKNYNLHEAHMCMCVRVRFQFPNRWFIII